MANKTVIAWAAAFGMLAITLGALGAHALEARLPAESLDSFKTAVRYQAWHALALFALGSSSLLFRYQKWIALLWIAGTILFSGSILILSTIAITGLHMAFLGPVTPVGGLALILGWFLLLLSALSKNTSK